MITAVVRWRGYCDRIDLYSTWLGRVLILDLAKKTIRESSVIHRAW